MLQQFHFFKYNIVVMFNSEFLIENYHSRESITFKFKI
jgi:hypothetical protein